MLNYIWVAIMFLPKSHTNIYLASPRIKNVIFAVLFMNSPYNSVGNSEVYIPLIFAVFHYST
jgi:hypothetical protein